MIHTHQTSVPGLFMNVDSVIKQEETYLLKGWIGSTINTVEDILINGVSLNPSFYQRTDVTEYYPVIGDMLGFEISLPFELMNNIVEVKMSNEVDISSTEVSFNQWIVFKSGYGQLHKDIIVVDNFYADPDMVRNYAMYSLQYQPSGYHKGQRSQSKYILEGTKERLEQIMGRKIVNWNHPNYANGVFQFCTADQPIVYHVDPQTYAAMVFLTPNAPVETGTAFYKSKVTGATIFDGTHDLEEFQKTFKGLSNDANFYDSTQYELMDEVANVYNRLVLFNAKRIHAATKYFGDSIENSRFFQLFFFDVV